MPRRLSHDRRRVASRATWCLRRREESAHAECRRLGVRYTPLARPRRSPIDGGTTMPRFRFIAAIVLAVAVGLGVTLPAATNCQEKTIEIDPIFDFSGPFSAAGSRLNYRGAELAIDWANDKGGVLGKYKVVGVDTGAQSKADVAINEAERLLNAEHVDILSGIYSSAHAVPIAERVDRQKKFLWITTAISDAVVKD